MTHRSHLRWPLLGVLVCQTAARAVVTTDGSLGAHASFTGSDVTLPASLGRQKGGNLFHSFGQFGVPDGGSVTFTGPTSVKNILARVTGGQASHIDGTLGSSIPGASLYLINPAGIVFGPDAQLNVAGSFTATTADVARLSDGAKFAVDRSGDSVLSGGSPAAFGFLNARPGSITLNGAVLVTTDAGIRIAGGSVAMNGGAAVAARGQHISIAAVQSGDATIDATTGDLVAAGGATRGPITLTDTNLITDDTGGGRIDVTGASLSMRNSNISAQTLGDRPGGGISIDLLGNLGLDGSALSTASSGAGRAGDIRVSAEMVSVLNGGAISARTYDVGPAGAVAVDATTLRVEGTDAADNNAYVATDSVSSGAGGPAGTLTVTANDVRLSNTGVLSADTGGQGNAGTVKISAGRMTVDGTKGDLFTYVSADSISSDVGGGTGGKVVINAGHVLVLNSGSVTANTYGEADAGSVSVKAHTIALDGKNGGEESTAISADAISDATGNAGSVAVAAPSVSVLNGAALEALSNGAGRGGKVAVHADSLLVQGANSTVNADAFGGPAGSVTVACGSLGLTDGGSLRALSHSPAPAGRVTVAAAGLVRIEGKDSAVTVDNFDVGAPGAISITCDKLSIQGVDRVDNSNVGIEARRVGTGPAQDLSTGGAIMIRAADFAMSDGADVSTSTLGDGVAGDVSVQAGRLELSGVGTLLTSDTRGRGNAGSVRVRADTVDVSGSGSRISVFSAGSGNSGNLRVDAAVVSVHDGGAITSLSSGAGAAGSVTINCGRLMLSSQGTVSSETDGSGRGGTVAVHAGDVSIDGEFNDDSTGVLSDADENSTGAPAGDVSVTSLGSIAVTRGGEISSGTEAAGAAGSVAVSAQRLTLTDGGTVSSSTSAAGHAGTVNVRAGVVTVSTLGIDALTGILSEAYPGATGAGGDLQVHAGSLSVLGNGLVDASTGGVGAGGRIEVNAGTITVDGLGLARPLASIASKSAVVGRGGPAGGVRVTAGSLAVLRGGSITSSTESSGAAGTVRVVADTLRIDGGDADDTATAVSSESLAPGTGAAGDVDVCAGTAEIRQGELSVQTFNTGRGGSLRLTCDRLVTGPSGFVTADTFGQGDAGSVTVHAGSINLTGSGRADEGGIEAATRGRGQGGDVSVTAGDVNLSNAAEISAVSTDRGAAGDVDLNCDHLNLRSGSVLTASASRARAGNVTVQASDTIDVRQSDVTTRSQEANSGNLTLDADRRITLTDATVTARAGVDGARLTLDPLFVTLNHSVINGQAGGVPVRVLIDPNAVLLRSNDSQILATNPSLPPDVDLTGAILHFVVPQFGGQTVLAEGCEMQLRKKNLSSFVGQERLGLPPVPGQGVMSGVANAPAGR